MTVSPWITLTISEDTPAFDCIRKEPDLIKPKNKPVTITAYGLHLAIRATGIPAKPYPAEKLFTTRFMFPHISIEPPMPAKTPPIRRARNTAKLMEESDQ